jgi:hypothetical protein
MSDVIFQARFGYVDELVRIIKSKYVADDSTMLQLVSIYGEPIAVATTCLEHAKPAPGNVFIKNWSENLGLLKVLQKAGVLGPVIREVSSGFVKVQECQLLMEDD